MTILLTTPSEADENILCKFNKQQIFSRDMRKFLLFLLPGLLILGLWGCSQDTGSARSDENGQAVDSKSFDAMDSLSILFGDLYGVGMKENRLGKDSTANLNQMYQEIEQIIGMDTVNVTYAKQVIELFQGISKQLGKPLNKDLFLQHFSENLKSSKMPTDDELKKMQESVTAQLEKISPGITHQEPTTFTTGKGTFSIENVLKRMYDEGVTDGSGKRSLHNKIPSSFSKSKMRLAAKDNFKQKWVIWYGKPDNEEAKSVYNDALEQYMKGFEDGWNF